MGERFRVILSTDDHKHAQFIPAACASWKKFFPECVVTVIMVPEKFSQDQLRIAYSDWCDELRFVEKPEGLPYPNACKLARMWAAGQYGDDVVLVEDMDLVLCNIAYTESIISQRKHGTLMLVGEEVYHGNLRLDGQCPMSKGMAESYLWKEISNPEGLEFPSFLEQFRHVRIFHQEAGESPFDSAQDFSDESLLRVLVSMWGKKDTHITHVKRNYNIQRDTLDRAWWRIDKEKLAAGGYYEAHLMKPLWHFVHFEQMFPLFYYVGTGEHYRKLQSAERESTRMLLVQYSAGNDTLFEQLKKYIDCERCIIEIDGTGKIERGCDRYSVIGIFYDERMPYFGDMLQLVVVFEKIVSGMDISRQRNWATWQHADKMIRIREMFSEPEKQIAEIREAGIQKVAQTLTETFTLPVQPTIKPKKRTTIALNMIACDRDADMLERCLNSFRIDEFFDEVVIGNTDNSQKIRDVALMHGAKCVSAPWADEEYPYGNFARARNAALDATESDWCMWLDSDDVLLDQYDDKWGELHHVICENAKTIDTFILPYTVFIDENGDPLTTFMRQRFWRRCKGFHWRNAVHEQLCSTLEGWRVGEIQAFHVTHLPGKPPLESSERNLKILAHEIEVKKIDDPQLRFFYARDLLISGQRGKGLALAWEIVSALDTDMPTLYNLMLDALMQTAYGGYSYYPILDMLPKDKLNEIEKYARVALAFSTTCAEPYVLLGDVYMKRGMVNNAMKMYQLALTRKSTDNVAMKFIPYYRELPADRLTDASVIVGDAERALVHNREAIRCNKYNPCYLRKRVEIMKRLEKETNELCNCKK